MDNIDADFETRWSVNKIKEASRATGSYWFSPDTMRTFGTKVERTVYQGPGGIFFITSEDDFRRERRLWTVRKFNPENSDIDTAGVFQGYTSHEDAQEAARELAGKDDYVTRSDPFKPVTVLEQFVADLRKHGSPEANPLIAERLMEMSGRHHRYMEKWCNGEIETDEEGELPAHVVALRNGILRDAKLVGATGVVFSGDPRGATVKLTFANGTTNDWGKEGYCVPTGEDE